MSQIKIGKTADTIGSMNSFGTVIELDGKVVRSVRSVELRASVDDVVTAKIEMFADDSFDVDLPADVQVTIIALDGQTIEETPLPNGGRRYRVVPE